MVEMEAITKAIAALIIAQTQYVKYCCIDMWVCKKKLNSPPPPPPPPPPQNKKKCIWILYFHVQNQFLW